MRRRVQTSSRNADKKWDTLRRTKRRINNYVVDCTWGRFSSRRDKLSISFRKLVSKLWLEWQTLSSTQRKKHLGITFVNKMTIDYSWHAHLDSIGYRKSNKQPGVNNCVQKMCKHLGNSYCLFLRSIAKWLGGRISNSYVVTINLWINLNAPNQISIYPIIPGLSHSSYRANKDKQVT